MATDQVNMNLEWIQYREENLRNALEAIKNYWINILTRQEKRIKPFRVLEPLLIIYVDLCAKLVK